MTWNEHPRPGSLTARIRSQKQDKIKGVTAYLVGLRDIAYRQYPALSAPQETLDSKAAFHAAAVQEAHIWGRVSAATPPPVSSALLPLGTHAPILPTQ